MSRTFEERVAGEIDSLYQGALFLSGGDVRAAETLIVEAVTSAFHEHAPAADVGPFDRWLEARLVGSFCARLGERPAPASVEGDDMTAVDAFAPERVSASSFFEAAAAVPPWARAALWLVLLRRWRYAEAADALGVDRAALVGLLGYRRVLLSELIERTRGNASRGLGS